MGVGCQTVTRELAEFVYEASLKGMPEALGHEAKRSILNGFAAALGGAADPVVERSCRTVAGYSGAPRASVIGRSERTDALTATFLNAMSTNVHDFDDTHPGTIIHPTAPVSPVAFALSEERRLSGARVLEAFILGVEVECRIGNAISPDHYRRGWHITSSCGIFGAAVAAGKLLGLSADQLVSAMGIASAQSSGLVETLGTMAKSVGVANAARNGMNSALLAQNMVDGPERPLEGERGFLYVTCEAPEVTRILRGIGEEWEVLRNTYKPYPCGVVLNPVIQACLEITEQPEFELGSVESVTVVGHPLLRERTDRPVVRAGREAQVSAQHAVAVCLIRGAVEIGDFADHAVHRPDVVALRYKIAVSEDSTLPVGAARVIIQRSDGKNMEAFVEKARGDTGQPLDDREIETKLRQLVAYGCPTLDPEPLIAAVWMLDSIDDATKVMALARL